MNSTEHTSDATLVAVPLWLRIMTVVYLAVVHTVGVPSNIITAIIYGRTSPRTACDWLILTMSVTDAVVCFFSPALHFRSFLDIPLTWKPGFLCSLEYWLQLTAMLASCFLLVVIALDRYVKICLPNKTSLTPLKARNVCIICVAIAATISIVPFLLLMKNANCYIWEVRYTKATRGYFSSLFCFFVISFFIVTFAYVSICKQINEKIKRKQRLILDNGLTDSAPLQSNTEGNDNFRTWQTVNLCFECHGKSRRKSYDSAVSSDNCYICCCFKTKWYKDNKQNSKHSAKVSNYDKNGKIDADLKENLQVEHSKIDVDMTADYKQGNLINHQRTNQSTHTSLDSANLQHMFETPDLHNIPQNIDSEMCAFKREDSIEIEGNQHLDHRTKQSTRSRVDYENQLGEERKIPDSNSNKSYSASATDHKNIGSSSTSGQRSTTELKTSRTAAASPRNSLFIERDYAALRREKQELELGKDYFPISSTTRKTQLCEQCYLRQHFAGDIKETGDSSKLHATLSLSNRIGLMRNLIFTSREFDKFRTSLASKPDISFLHVGTFPIQKSDSCPEMLAAGGLYRNNCCCCCRCGVLCNRTSNIYSTMIGQEPRGCLLDSVDASLFKKRSTKTKCDSVENKTWSPSWQSPSKDNPPCQQLHVGTRDVQPLESVAFNTNRCPLLAKSEPYLAGNNTNHSIYSCWCNGRKPSPVVEPMAPVVNVINPCDRPQSYIQVCSAHLKGVNFSRSVSFSDIVKEIPLELPPSDNQLPSLISTTSHDCQARPETAPTRRKFLHKNQFEFDDAEKYVKDTQTLIPPSSFPRDVLRSTVSLDCQESSQGDTGNLCADLPRETIFSRGLKRRQFKNSKESVMSTGSRKRFARERQMTRMLCSVTVSFLVSWIPPWAIYLLCLHASLEYSRSSIYPFLTTIHLFNYAASPVIYYTFNPTFRSKVNKLMTSLVCQSYCSRKARTTDVTT